jgi:leucyl/phenylalanyl-tRNA---protein transferase
VNLDPATILGAYTQGVFPMADPGGEIHWYTADPRGILPLETFHVSGTLRQKIKQGVFDLRINHDFRATMEACGQDREDGTWISPTLVDAYVRLHELGYAHSVETWQGGQLVGGLYGVHIGGAFFGESMFHRVTDASKVALVGLVERLKARDFVLLDTQTTTGHLKKFGAIEIPAEEYLARLKVALTLDRAFT